MNDLISRQAAIDALEWKWAGKAALDAIKELPSVEVEPVTRGNWVKVSDRNYKCSACGDWWSGEGKEIKTLLYCPNCGAKMDAPTIIEAEEADS